MRKFTTQILSLLTALSFAGALSAQTVEDAIGAADNATGGDNMGLTISGHGSFMLPGGSSTSYGNSGSAASTASEAVSYDFSGATGFGGGLDVAYKIAEGLNVTLGFDYRSYSTRTYKTSMYNTPFNGIIRDLADVTLKGQAAAAGAAATWANGYAGVDTLAGGVLNDDDQKAYADFGSSTSELYKATASFSSSWSNMYLSLGLRPEVKAWGGTLSAGFGLAYVLPYDVTTDLTVTEEAGALASSLDITTATQTDKWGGAIGAYGSLGYAYDIMPNLFVGTRLKVLFATAMNDAKTRVLDAKFADGTSKTATYTIAASHTEADRSLTATSTTTFTGKRQPSSNGITDATVSLVVGYRL